MQVRRLFAASLILATAFVIVDAQQTPRFQTSVDVVPVDVTVVDGGGRQVQDLTPADFTVRIEGQPRRVISAEWISLVNERPQPAAARVPDGYASNEQTANGRLIAIAVDQPNIPFASVRSLRDTLTSFLDALPASDRIAVIGFGAGAASVPFTADRERLKQAISRMSGQQQATSGSHSVGLSAAMRIDRDNKRLSANEAPSPDLDRLANQDCPPRPPANSSSRYVCVRKRSWPNPARSPRTRDRRPTRRFGRCKRCSPASRAWTPPKR